MMRYVVALLTRSVALCLLLVAGCAQNFNFHECESDNDCAKLASNGETLYCSIDRLCVDHLEGLCPVVLNGSGPGPYLKIASLVDRSDELDIGMERAVRLAIEEINQQQSAAGQPSIELHLCDQGDNDSGDQALAAIQYAYENWNISAVVGPSAAAQVIAVTQYAAANHILVITPSATSMNITSLHDDDMVWRTCPSDALEASKLAQVIQGDAPGNVDLVYADNDDGTSLANTFQQDFAIHQSWSFTQNSSNIDDAVQALNNDAPPAAVLIADSDAPILLAKAGSQPNLGVTKFYMTDAAKVPALLAPEGNPTPTSVLERVRGVAPATPSGPVFTLFQNAYETMWHVDPKDSSFSANAYDAAYLIAIAAAATSGHVPDGSDLVVGLRRLVTTGTAMQIGASQYLQVVSKMATQGSVNLNGASGPIGFDVNGDATLLTYEVWHIDTTATPPTFVTE